MLNRWANETDLPAWFSIASELSLFGGVRKPLEILQDIFGDKFNLCPQCGIGYLKRTAPRASPAEATE